jgi:hypothetical protein
MYLFFCEFSFHDGYGICRKLLYNSVCPFLTLLQGYSVLTLKPAFDCIEDVGLWRVELVDTGLLVLFHGLSAQLKDACTPGPVQT